MLQRLNRFCLDYLLMGPWQALALVAALAAAGAAVGLAFPKWNAEGLLETPGVVIPFEAPRENPDNARPEPKTRYVTLAEYRKAAAAYASQAALHEFLAAAGAQSPAAERLLLQSEQPGFWADVATPVLPFSRRDAREYGELKDAASDSLVGIELKTNARTPELASEMNGIMGSHFANALIRERIRAWILKNSGEAPAKQKALRAEVVEGQMKIEATGSRIQDLKAILARYPESGKLDSRQVVAISEGSDRFLSPLAQLVAAESSIAKQKETIARKEREARQFDLLERYFARADEKLKSAPLASEMIPVLAALTTAPFEGVDANADWAREVFLRLQADIAGFSSAQASFGFRNEARTAKAPWRDPVQLAVLGAAGALVLLGLIAFVRASMRAARSEADAIE
jgi:hypothetical protein